MKTQKNITNSLKNITNLLLVAAIMTTGANVSAEETPAPVEVRQVDINTAPASELEQLPGIGPSKAEAIVAYRAKRPFKKTEDIIKVKGIGRKTYKKLQAYLTVSPIKKSRP